MRFIAKILAFCSLLWTGTAFGQAGCSDSIRVDESLQSLVFAMGAEERLFFFSDNQLDSAFTRFHGNKSGWEYKRENKAEWVIFHHDGQNPPVKAQGGPLLRQFIEGAPYYSLYSVLKENGISIAKNSILHQFRIREELELLLEESKKY